MSVCLFFSCLAPGAQREYALNIYLLATEVQRRVIVYVTSDLLTVEIIFYYYAALTAVDTLFLLSNRKVTQGLRFQICIYVSFYFSFFLTILCALAQPKAIWNNTDSSTRL